MNKISVQWQNGQIQNGWLTAAGKKAETFNIQIYSMQRLVSKIPLFPIAYLAHCLTLARHFLNISI